MMFTALNQRSAGRCVASIVAITITVAITMGLGTAHAQTASPVPGTIDTSFGSGLPVQVNVIGSGGHKVDAVAVSPNGKVVMAGTCQPVTAGVGGARRWCFSRHEVDGTLDATFDGPAGGGNGKFALRISTGTDTIQAIAIQPDNKIVIAGECDNGLCVARLNVNGAFDSTFGGTDGWLYLGAQRDGSNRAVDVAVQADGKIVVGSLCPRLTSPGNDQACFWRLNADGSVDTTFDAGAAGAGSGRIALQLGDEDSQLARIAIQSNGKILALGTCKPDGFAAETTARFCFLRLNGNGAVDSTFSTDGRLRVAFSATKGSFAAALAVHPNGKILAGGDCSDGTEALNFSGEPTGTYFACLLRLNADGTLDAAFENPLNAAQNGKFLMKLDTDQSYVFPSVRSILAQSDGKTVVVFGPTARILARCSNRSTSNLSCVATRLNTDGSFDLLFDGERGSDGLAGNGIAYVDRLKLFTSPVAALRPDSKIIIAAACNTATGDNRLCVQQLNGGNGIQPACNLDIDGDGSVRTTSDGLLMMRALRSVIKADIVSNAGIAATAPRREWTEVRDYLVESCGAQPERGPRIARATTVCSLDIDGDGDVGAATDGVLLLRALLGFTGGALIADVPFATNATRITAASVGTFLSTRCGLSL
jgi:uncharacterized delta-60 repeat protein